MITSIVENLHDIGKHLKELEQDILYESLSFLHAMEALSLGEEGWGSI